MKEIELLSWADVPKRVDSVKRSLEMIYDVKLDSVFMEISIDRLYPTEDFLENDKLAFVFSAIIDEGYDIPIIAVENGQYYFVLDGHHRAYILKKLLKETIRACVLIFPKDSSYRNVPLRSLSDLPFEEVRPMNDPILSAWARILTILKHYEAMYKIPFYMKKKELRVKDLRPTQSQVLRTQIDAIKDILVPIACVEQEGRYYILDDHARTLRAKELDFETVKAIVVFPKVEIDFGIVKTAREMRLNGMEDVQIVK